MKDVAKCLKFDVFHKPFPLLDIKVPKTKSSTFEIQLHQPPQRNTTNINDHILRISFFQQCGILILIAQSFMSFMQL